MSFFKLEPIAAPNGTSNELEQANFVDQKDVSDLIFKKISHDNLLLCNIIFEADNGCLLLL